MIKNVKKSMGGLAALLTACASAPQTVEEIPETPAETIHCPEPDGITYFGVVPLQDRVYQLIAQDHDCDGVPTTGTLYLIIPLSSSDGTQYNAMIMTPSGFWRDANGNGQPEYEELTLKSDGPFAEE